MRHEHNRMMLRRQERWLKMTTMVMAVSIFVGGCGATVGGHSSQVSNASHSVYCGPSGNGKTALEIVIRDNDLTCQQAEAFMVLLPNSPGEFRIRTEKPGEREVRCHVYSSSSAGVSARCWVGSGEIELVD